MTPLPATPSPAASDLQTQEQYRLLVENSRDFGIFMMDLDGTIITWNPGAEAITGFTAEEIIGQPGALIFTPEDREAGVPERELATARREGRAEDERWHLRKDGSCFWGSGVTQAAYDDDGQLQGYGKVVRDHTERMELLQRERAARSEAEAAARQLRRLQVIADVALAHTGLDELLTELVQRIQQHLEVDTAVILLWEGEFLCARASVGLRPDLEPTLRFRLGEGFAGRVAAERQPIVVPDLQLSDVLSPALRSTGVRSMLGMPLWVEEEIVGVLHVGSMQVREFSSDVIQLLQRVADRAAIAIDRTRLLQETRDELARRQVLEQELRAAHGRVTLLSQLSAQLLLRDDPEAAVQDVYQQLADYLKLEFFANFLVEPDGSGLYLNASGGIPGEAARSIHRLRFGEQISGLVAEGREPWVAGDVQQSQNPTLELARSLGANAYACYPLITGDRLLGTVSFGCSRRSEFSPEELSLIAAVANQVSVALDRARVRSELEQRAEELAVADRQKDEFLAMLAHELRNPLAPILSAAEVIRLRGDQDPRVQRAQETVERQVQQMARLLDDLLDVSRITRGKIELRREAVDLATVVRNAVQTSRPLIDARRHALSVSVPMEAVCVVGDATRLEQILVNLLNNAAKYTDPGGRLWLTAETDGEFAVMRVRDTGRGIPPEMLPHVFDIFTQVEATIDRSAGGLGLGLTLVKRLTEKHGGTALARSEGAGRGSEFEIRLPRLVEAEASRLDARRGMSDSDSSPAAGTLRVLVVDDNLDAASTLTDLLELWNHEVRVALDGPHGLAAAREFLPDCIILDIGLPGMDGYEVAERLRREVGFCGRLLALTGYGRAEDVQRAMDAGFDRHVTKPVDPETLRRLLSAPYTESLERR